MRLHGCGWTSRNARGSAACALVVAIACGPAAVAPAAGSSESGSGDSVVIRATGASAWHAAGITGAGVTVAVIDSGFAGLAAAQAAGRLPAGVIKGDFCGGAFSTASSHGTAVAEVVRELAPAARLVLVCSEGVAALAAAKDFALARDASIINHSNGFYNQGRGDGLGAPGTPDATVADAHAKGALWVQAAGNSAGTHWAGTFSGPDGTYHAWVPGDRLNRISVDAGRLGCAYLRWDDWPRTDQDFDLYIVDAAGGFASGAQGARRQDGRQPPTEAACVRNDGPAATYSIAIWRRHATETPRMEVIASSAVGTFEHSVAGGSIIDPGASPSAFAVTAICAQTRTLEAYSSRGPTLDGRTKPDISGPAGLSTFTFGPSWGCGDGFGGTSAAAPAVAGAAALAEQALATTDPRVVAGFLQARAIDLGPPGRDNAFGAGALSLGRPPAAARDGTARGLARVRVSCTGSGPTRRRRIACTVRPPAAVRSIAARLVRGPRTIAVLPQRRRPSGRFAIGGASRGLSPGRYGVIVVLRDRAGASRTVRVSVRL